MIFKSSYNFIDFTESEYTRFESQNAKTARKIILKCLKAKNNSSKNFKNHINI